MNFKSFCSSVSQMAHGYPVLMAAVVLMAGVGIFVILDVHFHKKKRHRHRWK